MTEDAQGYIQSVAIGGAQAWYMMGHTFWSQAFSRAFLDILAAEYALPETAGKLWEAIFMAHLDRLKMKIRKYPPGIIHEFDTLDELRDFDKSYRADTRSALIKQVSAALGVREEDILHIAALKSSTTAADGFEFDCPRGHFRYRYSDGRLEPSARENP